MIRIITAVLCTASMAFSADVFQLKSGLAGQHPRILFTQSEADSIYTVVQASKTDDWTHNMTTIDGLSYPALDGSGTELQGQRFWWRATRLAITAALSRDRAVIDTCKVWFDRFTNDDWGYTVDATITLGGAHLIASYALLYDCIYNDLSAAQKTAGRDRILGAIDSLQVRGFDVPAYWTYDYQNNHMHFRLTAYLFCVLAVYGETGADIQTDADRAITQFRRLSYALAPDGTSHEGLGYFQYSTQMIVPAMHALRHCTGMDLMAEEHFRNSGYYYLYHITPGWKNGFGFGDGGNEPCSHPQYIYMVANATRDPYLQYFAERLRENNESNFWATQWLLFFDDATVGEADHASLPLHRRFDDLGVVMCRSDWSTDATAVAFKCGPMGGERLNECFGTEYNPHLLAGDQPWLSVAHDDPDAGTFLLFSKGSFLTTGDGYERTEKTSLQHSTMVVGDVTQFGGGGGWCQPPGQDKLARQKDYAVAGERVVFTGDMSGCYAAMDALDRTFVSHGTEYIIIHDRLRSPNGGRSYDWRFQTTGTLADQGSNMYKVTSGSATALVKQFSPLDASLTTTTNKVGNILRSRVTNREDDDFLVVIGPNAANLDAVDYHETATCLGTGISEGSDEVFTLFAKTSGTVCTMDDMTFTADAVVAVRSGGATGTVTQAVVTNGTAFSAGSTDYLGATTPVNFLIDTVVSGGAVYAVSPASGSDTAAGVTVSIGGLSASVQYDVNIDWSADNVQVTADGNGVISIALDLARTHRLGVGTLSDISAPGHMYTARPFSLTGVVTGGALRMHAVTGMEASVAVYRPDGTRAAVLHDGPVAAGWNAFRCDVPAGNYVVDVNGTVARVVVLD